ncbi:recombinase family protein [Hyphomicrobium sp. D-2]|uniref:recombinase family protein n=1 Tax=Hyphomicrobium sp. D-2 TaxID=3041621 RepID=UPI0024561051|nr:recombinase family protein [Hyphomicrobium sp. D-2]MDH4982177.1 recombinase family protein [Hyphomicrobium sp. D-2]
MADVVVVPGASELLVRDFKYFACSFEDGIARLYFRDPALPKSKTRLCSLTRFNAPAAIKFSLIRPALDQVVAELRAGDVLVTWKLDWLGRSLSYLISLISQLEARGVAFRSLSEAIDTGSAGGRLLFHIMARWRS